MPRRRIQPTPEGPASAGERAGLAFTLWLPPTPPTAGMVVLHGAGSRKENHHDMARTARAGGMAAIVADLRGHGESAGDFGSSALDDVAVLADVLREPAVTAVDPADGGKQQSRLPIVLRGSSLGGWLAICAAEAARADAIVAVCPATSAGLAAGLRAGRFDLRADVGACEALLAEHDPLLVVEASSVPLLLLHAEGDESVPVSHSRDLARRSAAPQTRLIVTPGGHHRSVQHDAELQGETMRWLRRVL